jgi:hypothetical protein
VTPVSGPTYNQTARTLEINSPFRFNPWELV